MDGSTTMPDVQIGAASLDAAGAPACASGASSCEPIPCVIANEGAGATASGFCVDAGPVPNCTDADIEAKNYDQSCQTDSDCVLVGQGESCFPCSLAYGPYGAISRSDLARFEADVAKTPAGNVPVSCAPGCTPSPSAYCLGGKCQVGSPCEDSGASEAASSSAACAEAGGQCLIGNVICAVPGPQSCGGITPAGLYCCLSNVGDCGQPDATTYACPGVADGGPSCQGGPTPPPGIPNFQALTASIDQDASYPAGCKVTFPGCNNGHVPYCTCSGTSPGFSGWTCQY